MGDRRMRTCGVGANYPSRNFMGFTGNKTLDPEQTHFPCALAVQLRVALAALAHQRDARAEAPQGQAAIVDGQPPCGRLVGALFAGGQEGPPPGHPAVTAPAPVVWTSERAIGDFCPASPVPRPGDPLPAPGQAEPGPAPRREPRVSRRHSFGRRFAVDCVVAAQSHETTTKRFDA